MGFAIADNTGKPVSLRQLDNEAAELWGKDLVEDGYVKPFSRQAPGELPGVLTAGEDWNDSIGWAIRNQGIFTIGWDNIKCTLWVAKVERLGMLSEYDQMIQIEVIQAYLRPYFALIDLWDKKGYKPLKGDY